MKVKREKVKLVGIMVLALFFNLIRNFNIFPMDCPSDELGTIVSAASLAGCNWSEVIHGSGYYGFGFYACFFWLFKLTDSPYTIYRVLIICVVLCRVVIIPIVYYIMKHYLNVTSQTLLYGGAFICAFMYSGTPTSISNEHPYELMIWVVILLLCKTIEYTLNKLKRKKILYSFLLFISVVYTLLLHTRATVLLLAILITIIAFVLIEKIFYQKVSVSAILFILLLLAGYFVTNKFINLYQSSIWCAIGSEIRNGSATVSTVIDLMDFTTWIVWFHMLIGMFGTQNIITAGLFSCCIVIFWKYLYDLIKKKNNMNIYILAISFVSILAMGGTLCSFFLSSWFEGMYTTWENMENASYYAYKGLLYVRYWNVYFPPFAIAMIALLSKKVYEKVLPYSLLANITLVLLFLKFLIPILKVQNAGAGFFYGISMYRIGTTIDISLFYKGILISLLFNILFHFFALGKKSNIAVLTFCIFFVFFQVNRICFYAYENHQHLAERVDASYELKCILEREDIDLENIYVYDDTSFTNYNLNINSILQFYL